MVLSHSKIDTLTRCPLAYSRRYRERVPEADTSPRAVGIAEHEIVALTGAQDLDEDQVYRIIARKAALLPDEAATDLRSLAACVVQLGLIPALPSDAQDVAWEQRFAIGEDGKPCEWNDPAALFRGIMDRRFRENEGTLGVVDDWKTGRVIEPAGDQLRRYGWALAVLFPEIETVTSANHYLRFGAVRRSDPMDAATLRETVPVELLAIREDLERRERDNAWEPRVSTACNGCGFRAGCPAFAGTVVPLRVIDSAEHAREAAQQLLVLRGQAKDLDVALRQYVRFHGEIEIDGSDAVGNVATERVSVTDPVLAYRHLSGLGVDAGAIWKALRLSKSSVEKLAASVAPRGEKGIAKEAAISALVSLGAAEVKRSTTFKRFKRGAEELPEGDDDGDE